MVSNGFKNLNECGSSHEVCHSLNCPSLGWLSPGGVWNREVARCWLFHFSQRLLVSRAGNPESLGIPRHPPGMLGLLADASQCRTAASKVGEGGTGSEQRLRPRCGKKAAPQMIEKTAKRMHHYSIHHCWTNQDFLILVFLIYIVHVYNVFNILYVYTCHQSHRVLIYFIFSLRPEIPSINFWHFFWPIPWSSLPRSEACSDGTYINMRHTHTHAEPRRVWWKKWGCRQPFDGDFFRDQNSTVRGGMAPGTT